MNNILQHFATALLDWHLKGDEGRRAYLEETPEGGDWRGFEAEPALGLRMERAGF
jgi:hypothetical protein